jgi:hypothetical protein
MTRPPPPPHRPRTAPTLAGAALLALAGALPFGACSQVDRDFGEPGGTGTSTPCEPGTTAPCYSGPEGTEGVGACAAGTMECKADGTGYGACSGEVLPAADDCATPEDEDCDGAPKACPLSTLWANGYIGGSFSGFPHVAADAAGNVIVAGSFRLSLDFGGGHALAAPDADGSDAFILKLGPDGSYLWSKQIGGPGEQEIEAVGVDATGNLFFAGGFDTQIDYGDGSIPSVAQSQDVFVIKLAGGDGGLIRGWVFGSDSSESIRVLAVDAAGQAFVGGGFYGPLNVGGFSLTPVGGADMFVAKLSASASQVVFAKGFGGQGYDYVRGMATDSAGNVIMTGSFDQTIDFGQGAITPAGQGDVFLAKLDGSGNAVMTQRFGDALDDVGVDVAVDADDNILVAGLFEGIVSFGGDPLAGVGASLFAASYTPEGQHRWSRRFGENETSDHLIALAADPAGNASLAGYFNTRLDFGGGAIDVAGMAGQDADMFVAKLDPLGEHVASRGIGTTLPDGLFDVAVDPSGATVAVGVSIGGVIDLGTGPLPVMDGSATYVVGKFAP